MIPDEQSGRYRFANDDAYFVIDASSGAVSRSFPVAPDTATAVAYNPHTSVFVGGSNTTPMQVRDNLTGEVIYGFGGYTTPRTLFSWTPNGRYLSVGSQVLDTETEQDIGMFQNDAGGVTANTWHPSGNFVTYGFTRGVIATYPGTAFPGFQQSPIALADNDQLVKH
ncbi:MAG: WD40 repeat domain-containing protein [Anaerolineae bacterium]